MNLLDRNRQIPDNLFNANDIRATATPSPFELVAAPGSGLSLYLTDLLVSNGATAGRIKLVEDSGSALSDVIPYLHFAANAGTPKHFDPPLQITANTNIAYSSVSVTTHSIMVSGFTAPSSIAV